MNDKLFFSVWRNIFLQRHILYFIKNQFIDFSEAHLSNRKPYDQIQSLTWMLEKRLYNIIKDKIKSGSILIINTASIDYLIKNCTDYDTFKILFEEKKSQIECVNLIKRSIELDSVFSLGTFLNLYENEENQENEEKEEKDIMSTDQDLLNFRLNEKENINIWMMNFALESSKINVAEYLLVNRPVPPPEKPGLLFRGAKFLSKFDASSKPDQVLSFLIEKMGVSLDLVVQNTKLPSMLPSIYGITKLKTMEYRLAFLRNKYLKISSNSQNFHHIDSLKDIEKNSLPLDFLTYSLLFKYHKKGKQYYDRFIKYLSEISPEETTIEKILDDHKSNCINQYINYYFKKNQLDKIEPLLTHSDTLVLLFSLSLKNFSIEGLNLFSKATNTAIPVPRSYLERSTPLFTMKDIQIRTESEVVEFISFIADKNDIGISWVSVFQIFQQFYPIELFDKVKSIFIKKLNKTFLQFVTDFSNNQFFDFFKNFFFASEHKNNRIDTDYIDLFFQVSLLSNKHRYKVLFNNINGDKIQDPSESIRVIEFLIDKHCQGNKRIFSSFLGLFDIIVDNLSPQNLDSPEEIIKYYNFLKTEKIQSFISQYNLELLKSAENRSLENLYFLNLLEILLFNRTITTKFPSYTSAFNRLCYIKNNYGLSNILKNNGSSDGLDHSINLDTIVSIFKSIKNLNNSSVSKLYNSLSAILNSNISFNQKITEIVTYLFSNQYFKNFDLRFAIKWLDHLTNKLYMDENQVLAIVKSIYNSIHLLYNKTRKSDSNHMEKIQKNPQQGASAEEDYDDELDLLKENQILLPILPEINNEEEEGENFTIQQFVQQIQPPTVQSLLPEQNSIEQNIAKLQIFLSNLTRKIISLNLFSTFKYLFENGLYSPKKFGDALTEYMNIRIPKQVTVQTNSELTIKIRSGNFHNLECDLDKIKKPNGYLSFYVLRPTYDMLLSNATVEQFDYMHRLIFSTMVNPSKLLFDIVYKNRFDLFEHFSEKMDYSSAILDFKTFNFIINNGEVYFLELLIKKFNQIFKEPESKIRLPSQIFKNSLLSGHIEITKLILKHFPQSKDFNVNKQLTNSIIQMGKSSSIKFLFENNLLINLDYLLKSNSLTTCNGIWKIDISEFFVSLINKIILKQQNNNNYNNSNNKKSLDNNLEITTLKRIYKKRNNLIMNSLATDLTQQSTGEQPSKRQRVKINNELKF
ncbi:hypothetical protein DICPUDRAFT_77401 [Dictyostelium purpureum]|uniref:Uncharacterized protein n=1 Tax=Dictyostelium purpureum TaxID=5786 RepID=F0ZGH9_DICPU|nr:uncharacterized protein DICPUDRAFT_77401 [Dictyostelium purpureum]EGC36959.1 hypothetical protein DICPUDRAFT_77401 [Dictyostelium purpureum]|eukprot:XP_003286527.1 hypothetical protein DICPUDRAFT_77401 [Dictyostelium purpureum]